jgi:hypothetical protein
LGLNKANIKFMGIEAFGVSMQFNAAGIHQQVKQFLEDYQGVRLFDVQTSSSEEIITGEYSDGSHFIDLQLSHDDAGKRCTLAARFSLCSYNGIDAVFIDLIAHILSFFDAEVWLMTSALKEKANYAPGDAAWLKAALPSEIAAMRKYWQDMFGTKQGAVRVKDSFAFVGATT